MEIVAVSLCIRKHDTVFLEDLRSGVRHGIDCMTHTVNKSRTVSKLLVHDLSERRRDLLIVIHVADLGFERIHHLNDLDVRTAVTGPLQRADRRGNGGIRVCTRRRQHTAGKGRVVTAAMLCVKHQAYVEQTRLFMRKLAVNAHCREYIFGNRKTAYRRMKEQRLMIVIAFFDLIRIDHNGRNTRDKLDRLTEYVFKRIVLRIIVIAVKSKHASAELVHDIGRRRLDDHIFDEAVGKLAEFLKHRRKTFKMRFVGQISEKQQPDNLFKAETILRNTAVDYIFYIISAVKQFTLRRNTFIFIDKIAVNIADACCACDDARTVRISESAFDIEMRINILRDVQRTAAVLDVAFQPFVEPCVVFL